MINILFSRLCILTFGTLYPGYNSFKTVRAKNVEDYVKWMMYWIVFAAFTASETFSDIFLAWFPFYYEIKVILILWLLPTMGNGSSYIYRNCIHPLLKKHESRVDYHLEQVREKGKGLILQYIKDGAAYIGNCLINLINDNFPNGILGLMVNNNTHNNVRPFPLSESVVIEEIETPQVTKRNLSQRKNSLKTSKNKNAEEAQKSQGHSRKTRQSKQEIDQEVNES